MRPLPTREFPRKATKETRCSLALAKKKKGNSRPRVRGETAGPYRERPSHPTRMQNKIASSFLVLFFFSMGGLTGITKPTRTAPQGRGPPKKVRFVHLKKRTKPDLGNENNNNSNNSNNSWILEPRSPPNKVGLKRRTANYVGAHRTLPDIHNSVKTRQTVVNERLMWVAGVLINVP